MKTIKQIFTLLFVFTTIISCNEDFMEETDFGIVAPSEVSARFQITQDNTGLVTITPTAVNAISFDIVKKGSEVLIEEFPENQDFLKTKEKIEEI